MAEIQYQMNGVQRAAVLLMSIGEEGAAEVLKHMTAKEVQKLGVAMASMPGVTRHQVDNVVKDFVNELDSLTSLGVGADEYVRKVLEQALGEDKAKAVIDRILYGHNTKGLDALKWMEPRAIAELIRNEHPQIIAIVLSHLDSDQAADVLKVFPERARADVMMRIATLDGIPPNALNELNEIMERQFSGNQNLKSSAVGGLKVAADILNHLEASVEQTLMSAIHSTDPDLGGKIQDLMFVFDNLVDLDDRAIQTLLREVSNDKLGTALRGADPKVSSKIFKNMSSRAAQILQEDMEARGPVRLADVEAAQKEVLAIVRRLAEEGQITIGGGGEEFL